MNLNTRRAIFVYEGARLHAIALRCPVIPAPWDLRESEFKEQFKELISDLCSGKRRFQDPEAAHDSWVKKYYDLGWRYGEKYNPEQKTHPDLVPFENLDPKEKIKDEVFMTLVEMAKRYIW